MNNTHAKQRESEHAKLLNYQGRQVLAHLYRDENDALSIVLQLWVAATDEQLRVSVSNPDRGDEAFAAIFQDLNDESVALMLDHLGVPALVEELSNG